MPHAQKARLISSLEDYITAYRGDGVGRTGNLGVPDDVKAAKGLLDSLGGSQDIRGDTPGRRAAGSTGEGAPNFSPEAAQSLVE